MLVVANKPPTDIFLHAAAGNKWTRTKSARGVFASNAEGPRVATRERPSSPGFFDNAVGSQFANRPSSPTKAASQQPAPQKAASTPGKLLVVMSLNSSSMKCNRKICMTSVQHCDIGIAVWWHLRTLVGCLLVCSL